MIRKTVKRVVVDTFRGIGTVINNTLDILMIGGGTIYVQRTIYYNITVNSGACLMKSLEPRPSISSPPSNRRVTTV